MKAILSRTRHVAVHVMAGSISPPEQWGGGGGGWGGGGVWEGPPPPPPTPSGNGSGGGGVGRMLGMGISPILHTPFATITEYFASQHFNVVTFFTLPRR